MNDEDLRQEYFRVHRDTEACLVLVRTIHWKTTHEPEDRWVLAAELHAAAPQHEVEETIEAVIQDEHFFGVCVRCEQRFPAAGMSAAGHCSGCAERFLEIVH